MTISPGVRKAGRFAGRVWRHPAWDAAVVAGAAGSLRRNIRSYRAGGRVNPTDVALNAGFGTLSAVALKKPIGSLARKAIQAWKAARLARI